MPGLGYFATSASTRKGRNFFCIILANVVCVWRISRTGQMSTEGPREKAVFCQALEIADPEQRRQFLDDVCGADAALREQVEKLLAISPSAGDFFQDCAPAL